MTGPSTEPSTPAVIGVDLGGTKITAGLVMDERLSWSQTAPTPAADGPAAVVEEVLGLIATVRAHARAEGLDPAAIGIGSAGVIDPATGTVVAATEHIAGWAGTPLAEQISLATGLPTGVLNDVHAHGLGEARFGAGRGLTTLLLVAAGTGLGGALVLDGHPVTGRHGAAGHLGHVPAEEAHGIRCACGGTGHLESVASGTGLLAMYLAADGQAASALEVAQAAGAGDPLAVECLTTSGRALGAAIGGWINTLDPDAVIVTGGLAAAGPLWWDALGRAAHQHAIDLIAGCPIVPAALGAQAAVLGAAAYASSVPRVPQAANGVPHA